jgi:uncharacterized protein YcbK (DUF882 family)
MAVKTYSKSKQGNVKLSAHFVVREFASPDSDTVKIDTNLISILERLYDFLDCSKIIITSGYRTPAYDRSIGCSGRGYHTTGQAADVNCWHKVNGKEVRYHGSEICCALQELGWKHGIGWIAGCAVHIDTRLTKYWFDEQNGNRSIGNDWYKYMASKGFKVKKIITLGDVNFDGKVDSTDARIALQASVGKTKLTEEQKQAADVNKDGKVDSTDARTILQAAVGKVDLD